MKTEQLFIKMVLDRWYGAMKNFESNLDSIPDEQLNKQIAPGKNRGTYLLGHIIAVHDDMRPLMGLGEKQYPELHETFINSPDKADSKSPSVAELKSMLKKQNESLSNIFNDMKPEEWFQKHNSVSAEDFAKEPHRNKMNIVITRTTHLTYHTGQLALLK
jgi:hypothetical protein